MDDEEVLELWHSLKRHRRVQLLAIMRYMADEDAKIEELATSTEPHKDTSTGAAPQQRFYQKQ